MKLIVIPNVIKIVSVIKCVRSSLQFYNDVWWNYTKIEKCIVQIIVVNMVSLPDY